jgi:hypothetical protein
VKLSAEVFMVHRENYDGYCRTCDEITNLGGVEPDAAEHPCEVCESLSVFGVEDAMLHGWIEITK